MNDRMELRRDLNDGGASNCGPPVFRDPTGLRIETSRRGPTQVIALLGEARVWERGTLECAFAEVAKAAPRDVVIDLSVCTVLSSVAFAQIVHLSQTCRRSGGAVRLAAPRPNVLWIIRVLRLEVLCPVHDTVKAALEAAAVDGAPQADGIAARNGQQA